MTTPTAAALRSVRPGPVFFGLLAAAAAGGYLVYQSGAERTPAAIFGALVLVLAGWIISLALHEFAHAFTAFRYGDRSAELRGYLTLNPLKYTHPALSIGLPVLIILFGGIGFPGGAVYLNTAGMTRGQRSRVSLAGPLTNVALAVILLAVIAAVPLTESNVNLMASLAMLAFLQVTAAILNLLPVPGLDGYHAIEPYLSDATRRQLDPLQQFGFLILIVALFIPPINRAFFDVVFWFIELSGIPLGLVGAGWDLFVFWR